MNGEKKNIKDVDLSDWPEVFKSLGLKPYAHKQIFQWLFRKGVTSFEEMTNLSKKDRQVLSEHFYIGNLKILETLEDEDATKKFLFELTDGEKIESVLIPMENERQTLCISSQVGCALDCLFCRTGKIGIKRNLTQSEIVDQVLRVSAGCCPLTPALSPVGRGSEANPPLPLGERNEERGSITNIVFMGMGEPLNNYENVKNAIKILTDENGLSFGNRRITLSTAGVVPGIKKMAEDNLGVKLAVSLNATTDEFRKKIMPIARKYSIDEIISACLIYSPPGSRWRTTFEYVLIGGLNDALDDAKRLVALMSRLPSKVNLIPFNPFPGSEFKRPKEEDLKSFYNYLYQKHVQVNIRQSRGTNIFAACGQLAAE